MIVNGYKPAAVHPELPPEKLQEPHTAVYTAVLLLGQGQPDAAKQFVDAANGGFVFAEEKKLLQDALQKSQSTETATPSPSATVTAVPSPTPVDLSPR